VRDRPRPSPCGAKTISYPESSAGGQCHNGVGYILKPSLEITLFCYGRADSAVKRLFIRAGAPSDGLESANPDVISLSLRRSRATRKYQLARWLDRQNALVLSGLANFQLEQAPYLHASWQAFGLDRVLV